MRYYVRQLVPTKEITLALLEQKEGGEARVLKKPKKMAREAQLPCHRIRQRD